MGLAVGDHKQVTALFPAMSAFTSKTDTAVWEGRLLTAVLLSSASLHCQKYLLISRQRQGLFL